MEKIVVYLFFTITLNVVNSLIVNLLFRKKMVKKYLFLMFKGHFVPHQMKRHDFSVFYTRKPLITILLLAQCLVHAGKVTGCRIKV